MAYRDRIARMQASDNRNYQRMLADTLIATLGQDGAAHACQQNAWDGVLAYVLANKGAKESRPVECDRWHARHVETL